MKAGKSPTKGADTLGASVINSLTAHIAVLDGEGEIVAVNDAWRRFAAENGGTDAQTGVGASYLRVCGVPGEANGTREIAEGIRAVLRGSLDNFTAEYPCHSPQEERWFLLYATPLPEGGAVVSHVNITDRKLAEDRLAELLSEREQTLEEVSTPIVPVLEGVLILPLIGTLDTSRAERATHALLTEVTRQGARAVILDITGARIVDSHAVARLTNLVQALKLVGADAFVTGISAQVAQTLVGLGLDMQGLKTFRTLAQALAALINRGRRAR